MGLEMTDSPRRRRNNSGDNDATAPQLPAKEVRLTGIGERLKRYQRDVLLTRGVERVYWTFDPLDAKNAYVNFVRLGIVAREYRIDMYGKTASPLHEGIGTDRLIAVWPIASKRVEQRLVAEALREPDRDVVRSSE